MASVGSLVSPDLGLLGLLYVLEFKLTHRAAKVVGLPSFPMEQRLTRHAEETSPSERGQYLLATDSPVRSSATGVIE